MSAKKFLISAAFLPLGLMLPCFSAAVQVATVPQFQTHVDYPVGLSPAGLRMEDLNDDGHLDAVVTNGGSNTISVLLGKGDGTLLAKADYPTGINPAGIEIGDLNRDGVLDVVVSNQGKDGAVGTTVNVLRGKGDGSFNAKKNYTVGTFPWGLQIGDLDRDGVPDIVSANYLSSTVSVLFGKSAGGFKAKVDWPTSYLPRDVRIGDLNRDGKPDLITANYGGGGGTDISVLLGVGTNGRFAPTVNHTVPNAPTSVQAGDINRDGKPDVVVTSYTDPSTVTVLSGDGKGAFPSQIQYFMNGRPDLQLKDLNRDGWLDFVAVNFGGVSLLLSDGLGQFQAPVDFATGAGATALQIGDLNHDGKPDLVTANSSGTVSVLLGQ
ncbi:MAG: VCBS repeat-containing protein [Methylococcaceae bacterium]